MTFSFRQSAAAFLMIGLFALVGCESEPDTDSASDQHGHSHGADGHGHSHAHPETFAEAMEELSKMHATIKEGFAADDVDAAHGPLHEIGHLLEELPELASGESLSEEDQEKVKQSVDVLMDSYGAVDERLHADESVGKSYDDVAEQIDAAMADLKAIELPENTP